MQLYIIHSVKQNSEEHVNYTTYLLVKVTAVC